jgi:hypothetical protein
VPRALLVILLLLLVNPVVAADASVSIEVPAGKSKNIRLRNLPAGGAMAVRIISSGKLLVALLSEKQLKSPQPEATPLFRGVVERRITFKVSIPESGDYFLVLSNRGGTELLEVQAEIRAVAAPRRPAPRDYSPRPEKASMSPRFSSI